MLGDDPNDSRAGNTAHVDAVIAAMKEDSDLLRFVRVEAPPERGLGAQRARLLARAKDDVGEAIIDPLDRHEVVVVGGMDLHLRGEESIEAIGGLAQMISPYLECSRERGAVHRVQLWRDAPYRVVDDGIRQPSLEPGGDGIPGRLVEASEKSPVEDARIPRKPDEVGIGAIEAHELRLWI